MIKTIKHKSYHILGGILSSKVGKPIPKTYWMVRQG